MDRGPGILDSQSRQRWFLFPAKSYYCFMQETTSETSFPRNNAGCGLVIRIRALHDPAGNKLGPTEEKK